MDRQLFTFTSFVQGDCCCCLFFFVLPFARSQIFHSLAFFSLFYRARSYGRNWWTFHSCLYYYYDSLFFVMFYNVYWSASFCLRALWAAYQLSPHTHFFLYCPLLSIRNHFATIFDGDFGFVTLPLNFGHFSCGWCTEISYKLCKNNWFIHSDLLNGETNWLWRNSKEFTFASSLAGDWKEQTSPRSVWTNDITL